MKWFSNLKISTKLVVTFLLILILTSILGLFSLRELARVNQSTEQASGYLVPALRDAAELQSVVLRIRVAHLILTNQVEDAGVGNPIPYLATQTARARELLTALQGRLVTEEGRRRLASIETTLNQLLAVNNDALKAINEQQTIAGFAILEKDASAPSRTLMNEVSSLNTHLSERAATLQASALAIYENARIWIIALLVAAFVIGIVLVLSIAGAVSSQLRRAVSIAQNVASGNLTDHIEVRSKDETGQLMQALKDMNGNLQDIVQRIRHGSETINVASAEISAGNLDLSSRTEQQASSLEETASSMEELTTTVKQNADNARQANQLAASASDVAQQGGDVVQKVVETMGSINDSSKRIVDIITVIDGIAFQTNILALNAAVEAARAGEQGRGFAVVATEVRSLAQRSASAAKEIKSLIDDSVQKVGVGTSLVAQAGTTMHEVVSSIRRVTDIVGEITAASQEQSAGIEQVNQAIVQMDEVTQQNASLVEEAAAAAQALQTQAKELVAAVSTFTIDANAQIAQPAKTPTFSAAPASVAPRRSVDITPPQPAIAKSPARVPAVAQSRPAPAKREPAAAGNSDGDWEEF